jgi:hypothetical protein
MSQSEPDSLLGVLGRLAHYRCRFCGIDFSVNLDQDAQIDPPDPNINRESKYFEIFARRDPNVGIKDVYEKVTFESGLFFSDTEDLEEIRRLLTKVFTEIYGGFTPVILFDFEPHDYYKPNGQETPSPDLPFDTEEMIALLEVSRLALADEDLMMTIGEKMDLSYDAMIDLHDKLIAYLEDNQDPHADQWFIVLAVEKGEDGRELAINKPGTLSAAVKIAEDFHNMGHHGYEKIVVKRQPDQKIVWDSSEQ